MPQTKPSILILHAGGTNRDGEAAWACELAGGAPEIVHINQLRRGERRFQDYDMLLLPGGFSYGDALGAGARQALDLHVFFHDQLQEFVSSGKRVLGICNGFQTLVRAGLLPGMQMARSRDQEANGEGSAFSQSSTRSVTLTHNASGRFECRWVYLQVARNARADFLADIDEPIFCPVAHGEGNFQATDEGIVRELDQAGLIVFRYVGPDGSPADGRYPLNPNGSVADIAGICNERGNVVGLMPHPEDHVLPIQNPLRNGYGLARRLFEAAITN